MSLIARRSSVSPASTAWGSVLELHHSAVWEQFIFAAVLKVPLIVHWLNPSVTFSESSPGLVNGSK